MHDRLGDFLRAALAADGDRHGACLPGAEPAGVAHRVDHARHHAIDGDAGKAELLRKPLGEADQPRFGGADMGALRHAHMRGDAAHIHDPPPALRLHGPQHGAGAEIGPFEDDRLRLAPVGERRVEEGHMAAYGSIVDQDIHRTRRRRHRRDGRLVGHVRHVQRGGAARRLDLRHDRAGRLLRPPRVDADMRAVACEPQADFAADIAAGAGDEGCLSGKRPAAAHWHARHSS